MNPFPHLSTQAIQIDLKLGNSAGISNSGRTGSPVGRKLKDAETLGSSTDIPKVSDHRKELGHTRQPTECLISLLHYVSFFFFIFPS